MFSDEPFHSLASFNMISIAGIHFAYTVYTLAVARSGKPPASLLTEFA